MPELPEVETIARGVNARVRGDQILEVWLGSHPEPFKNPAVQQARGLEGRQILVVHRKGKHIVRRTRPRRSGLETFDQCGGHHKNRRLSHRRVDRASRDDGAVARDHARGSRGGAHPCAASRWPAAGASFCGPAAVWALEFRDLSHGDRFGAPGAEPLTIGTEAFATLFRGRRLAIKAALLNQTLLAGVGNIYADESLFRAGVRPRRMAGRLTREELERLRLALREVLRQAIRRGGSSVSDYVDADGVRGFFQLEHRVYQRTGQPCLVCKTPIRRIVLAGRSTHYCPRASDRNSVCMIFEDSRKRTIGFQTRTEKLEL